VALRPLTWVAVRLDAVSAFRLPVLRPLICVEVSAAVWATLNWPIWPALIAFSVTLDRAPTIAFDRAPIWLAERTPIPPRPRGCGGGWGGGPGWPLVIPGA